MKNSARIVALLLPIALLALPVWGGRQAYTEFEEASAALERAAAGRVVVETTFHRGWLRSTAETRIAPLGAADSGALVLEHRIVHGPLPLGELLEGRWPRALARAIVTSELRLGGATADSAALLRSRMQIALDGSTTVDLASPPRADEQGAVVWEGLSGRLASRNADWSEATGRVESASLRVATGEIELAVEGLALDFESHADALGVPTGRGGLALDRLALKGPGSELLLEGLRVEQSTAAGEAERLRVKTEASLARFVQDGRRHGPGTLALELVNLDVPALRSLQSLRGDPALEQGVGPDPAQALQALGRLLARSPALELHELSLRMPDGELRASGRLRVAGDDPRVALSPLLALSAIEGELDAQLPTRLTHRILDAYAASQTEGEAGAVPAAMRRTRWIQALSARGLLTRDAAGYRVRLGYAGGVLTLNGRPVDLGELAPPPAPH